MGRNPLQDNITELALALAARLFCFPDKNSFRLTEYQPVLMVWSNHIATTRRQSVSS
jgi:hypothetical protein